MWMISVVIAGISIVCYQEVSVLGVICHSHYYLDQVVDGNKTEDCPEACYAYWIQDKNNLDHITVIRQGCWRSAIKSNASCIQGPCTIQTDTSDENKFCCCYRDRCNKMEVPGVNVSFHTYQTSKLTITGPHGMEKRKGKKHHRNQHRVEQDYEDLDSYLSSKQNPDPPKRTYCAFREFEAKKRTRAVNDKENKMSYSTPSNDISTEASGQNVVLCTGENDSCFSFWSTDDEENATEIHIIRQGCFKSKPEDGACTPNVCTSTSPPKKLSTQVYNAKYGKFCCCYGNMCNQNVSDSYEAGPAVTTIDVAYFHIQDGSYAMYKEKTIIISLVSVCSVALITMGLYLLYRICMSSRKPSPDSLNLVEAPPSSGFEVDDLKINYQISQTKNGEVWQGTLVDLPVAVKIFSANHKQLYQNEKYIYTLPHIEHANLLKFYGSDERLTPDGGWKYLIVLSYASKGSLYDYLRAYTLDWATFCKMCLSASRGVIHLHTDVRKGDKFKPTVAHRDLNTRNILVREDLSCVIGDLGFAITTMGSKLIKNGQYENAEQASLQDVGTLRYMAPELLDGAANLRESEASLKQIDVYALGLVLWEIATRCSDLYHGVPMPEYQLPYQKEAGMHPSFEEMQILVSRNKVRPKFPDVWRDYNQAVRALKETIEDCWDHDSEARLTAMCVEERILDMMALWNLDLKNKGSTPTVTTTSNFLDMGQLPDEVSYQNEGVVPSNSTTGSGTEPSSLNVVDNSTASHVITSPPNGYINSENIVSQQRPVSWSRRGITTSASTTETFIMSPSEEEPPQKMLNVTMAKNNMVLGPRQGRNPTVERNTHKRSDEEIAVSGNKLVYNNERRGSDSVQSAPPLGEDLFDAFSDHLDTSLVQSDVLNHSRSPRIPLVQNQVHNDHRIMRPKVANLPTTNPLLRDSDGIYGDRSNSKSKLGKLIKVKDIGSKLSQIAMLAKRASKNRGKNRNNVKDMKGSANLDLVHGHNVQNSQNTGQRVQLSNQIVDGANKNTPVQTEVRIKNGAAFVRPMVDPSPPLTSLGTSDIESPDYSSVHGHDNRLFTAEVGVAKLETIPLKGHQSFMRVRKGSQSKSTPDLSPQKSFNLKNLSQDDDVDEVTVRKRPTSLSLRGHNYKQKLPTKSSTCESLNSLANIKSCEKEDKNETSDQLTLCQNEDDGINKIKRRIKTPVKVKHGRFSLYDDRLMDQFVQENPELIDRNYNGEFPKDKLQRSKSGSSSEFLLDGCDDSNTLYNVQSAVHVV